MAVNQNVINQAKKEYDAAKAKGDKAGMAAAHAKAENERAKAGYSGGADGSQKISISSGSSSKGSSGGSGSYVSRTPTTVYNPDGSTSQGYIQNGATYYNDGSRISEGAKVIDNSGKEWVMQNGQGVLTGNNYDTQKNLYGVPPATSSAYLEEPVEEINPYDNLYSIYEQKAQAALKAQQEALRQGINNSVMQLEGQKASVNSGYEDAARQAYILKMQNERGLAERLASQGQNGGATETANLAIGANYETNMADLGKSRMQTLLDIDKQIASVKTSGSIEEAQLAAQSGQSLADTYLQLAQNRLQQEKADMESAKQDFTSTATAYSNDYQAQINKLQALLNAGQTYDDDGVSIAYKINVLNSLRNDKITNQNAAALSMQQQEYENWLKEQNLLVNQAKAQAYINKQNASASKSSSKGSSSPTLSQINKMFENGGISAEEYKALIAKFM